MGCFSIFTVLCLLSFTFTEAKPGATASKLPVPSSDAAFVVGTVYCDTCFQDADTRFISGASVAVECRRRRFRKQVKTDEQGKFKVKLPFSVSKQVQSIRRCSVKLVSSCDPSCAVASTANSTSSLHRIKNNQGDDLHVFSAGFFTFRPAQRKNNLCSQKDLSAALPTLPEMNQNHFMPFLPKLPPLPPLPALPRMPFFPPWYGKSKQAVSGKPPTFRKGLGDDHNDDDDDDDQLSNQKSRQQRHETTQPQGFLPMPPVLPPNPFQPPPSVLPPILPTPPPSFLPSILPTPPPSFLPPVLTTPRSASHQSGP